MSCRVRAARRGISREPDPDDGQGSISVGTLGAVGGFVREEAEAVRAP